MHVKGGVEDLFDRVLPARSWEMPEEHELPAKVGRCNEKLLVHNFDRRAKSSLYTFRTSSHEDFALASKLRPANFSLHRVSYFFSPEIRVNFGRP